MKSTNEKLVELGLTKVKVTPTGRFDILKDGAVMAKSMTAWETEQWLKTLKGGDR
jgi:hypothetical protein